MTLNDIITRARSLAEHGCSYVEACELFTRDLGRPLTPDERQEVWAATDGDGDTPAQVQKPVAKDYNEVVMRLSADKQRFVLVEFVAWNGSQRRKVEYTVYMHRAIEDQAATITAWASDYLTTGRVPLTAKLWQTPGVAR